MLIPVTGTREENLKSFWYMQKYWQIPGKNQDPLMPMASGNSSLYIWYLYCNFVSKGRKTTARSQFYLKYKLRYPTVIILYMKPTWWKIFLSMFISFLYMFRASMCLSSGETTVSMRHLVLVTLCWWLSGMQYQTRHLVLVAVYGWLECISDIIWYAYQTVIHTWWQVPSVA